MSKTLEKKLILQFQDRGVFSRKDLWDFFVKFEPDLNDNTFTWRIHNLKNKNIITSVRRGFYMISEKPKYIPEISGNIIKLVKSINKNFEDVKYCIWNTLWINEFAQHQSSKNIIIIEIEKDFVESLYYELKDTFRFDFFLNPDKKIIDFYVAESQNPVVIKKLITRSPITKRVEGNIRFYTPLLEKILVDIFTEDRLFYFFQGSEMIQIYENAFKKYSINFTKLFAYAKRREKEKEINRFIINNINNVQKDIIK